MTLFKTYLELENYEIKQLDLMSSLSVPEDCKTLFIATPKKDITTLEADALKSYIEKGGDIFWVCNPYSLDVETPNLDSVLSLYGVKVKLDGVMLEQNMSKMIMNAPDFILPSIGYSEATEDIKNVLLIDSGKLEFVDSDTLSSLSCQKTDLLTTSPTAFYRTDISFGYGSRQESETAEMTVVGALMEKQVQDSENTSKLIIIANNLFMQDQPIPVGNSQMSAIGFYNNMDFALDCIGHLSDMEDTIVVRKDVEIVPYTATETQDNIIKAIIFTVPVLIILIGIVVWALRRRKK